MLNVTIHVEFKLKNSFTPYSLLIVGWWVGGGGVKIQILVLIKDCSFVETVCCQLGSLMAVVYELSSTIEDMVKLIFLRE